MADEAKATGAAAAPPEPNVGELEFEDWSYRLLSLERVMADPGDDDGEDIFTAKFQVDGPNANAEIEIIVSDLIEEAHVVSIGQHTRGDLSAWWALCLDRPKDWSEAEA